MNFRDATHGLFRVSRETISTANRRVTVVIAGVLLVVAGFAISKFVLNFDQLQRLAEENSRTIATQTSAPADSARLYGNASPAATPEAVPSADPAVVEAWLGPLNRYRAMVGLSPVAADPRLSRGDFLHSHYLVLNYGRQLPDLQLGSQAHTEDPAKPGFTTEGLAAAGASDVDWMWDPRRIPQSSWAIKNWMQVPFHRVQIINPNLHSVGYGTYCQGGICIASLDTGSDIDPLSSIPSPWPKPVEFPPDGSVMDGGAFSGEWPDPLTSCAGYTSPAGLPITLELGQLVVPGFSDYSVRSADANGASLAACAFDANSYVNPDPAAQATGRGVLRQFGAIVIVPRRPLSLGRYTVAITAGGQRYSWSFAIAPRNRD